MSAALTPDHSASSRLPPRFVWLVATLVCLHASMATTRVAASLWVLRQGLGEWAVGLVLASFAVAPMFLSMWAGRQADRYGLRRPLRIALVMALAGALLSVVFGQLWAIALACLLTGGALSVGAVGIQREAGRMAPDADTLKRLFSWISLGPALSNTLAPLAAGLLIDWQGFGAAFALALALPLLAALLAARIRAQRPPASVQAQTPGRAWALLREPQLLRLLLVNIILAACWDAHGLVVPVVGHARGLSASAIGAVLSSFAVATIAVRLFMTRWSGGLDELRVLRLAIVVSAATLAVYAWLPGTAGLMLGSALLGVALGSVQPMVMSLLHQVVPASQQGQALGLRMTATNAATVAMPLGFGLLAAGTAAMAPLWLMSAMLVVALRAAQGLRQPKDHAGPDVEG
ncbi:MFS transporter [Roseateles sp. BYS180W]|uniref:MFS transporter n=1 Tax=Roseateles rivi TaxID=3299028 RepID=A0ABW7FYF9_9BURK